ncbi:MAG: hypothetical protein ABIF17_03350 [Patescibacteria group bacterium]
MKGDFCVAIEIKRKGNESNESLLRRFQERIKRSRVLNLKKQTMHHTKDKNKAKAKKDALIRNYNRSKREFLIKIGKLPETPIRGGFKKR